MMSGGVLELACRNSLRSSHTKVKIKKEKKMRSDEGDESKVRRSYGFKAKNRMMSSATTEKEKEKGRIMLIILSDDDEDEEEVVESVKKVKSRKESAGILGKEKRKRVPINHSDDKGEELEMRNNVKKMKNKEDKRMRGGDDDKVKNKKGSGATSVKEKSRKMWNSYSGEEKMNRGGHDKDKKRSMTVPFNKNKNNLMKDIKIPRSNSSVKKTCSSDLHKDKRRNTIPSLDKSKHSEKEKKKILSSHNGEKKMCYSDHDNDKMRRMPLSSKRNEMQKSEMKKRTTPILNVVKDKKMQPNDHMEMKVKNVENKEEKKNAPSSLSKENKIQTQTNSKEKKRKTSTIIPKKAKTMRIDDNDKTMGGYDTGKEGNIQGDGKKHNSQSDGKEKKMDAPLAFFKVAWNNFKEFMLIPPIIAPRLADLTNRHVYLEDSEGKSSKIKLSVVEGSLAFCQGWSNFVSDHSVKRGHFLLFEYTAHSKFSVRVFGLDSSERLCFNVEIKDGMKKSDKSHGPGSLVPCHKEDTSKPIPLNAAPGTCCLSANTKEDPKEVTIGSCCGSSVAIDNNIRSLPIEECKTESISPMCWEQRAGASEEFVLTDAAPLAQENDATVKLAESSHHIEGSSMLRQSDPEVVTPIKCMEINDSDEDLRTGHKRSMVQLECTTVVGKCPKNSKMNTNSSVLRKYEAPGGSRWLEKWNKHIVSGQAALDSTGPVRPENPQNIVDKLVGDCSVMRLNPIKQWPLGSDSTRSCLQPMPVKTDKSGYSGTSIHQYVDREGTACQLRTKKEQLEPVGSTITRQKNNIPTRANDVIARQPEHHFFRQEDVQPSNRASSPTLMSVKVEVLELDGHSMFKTNLQFCIPSTTQTWLELPESLSDAIRQKGRQDRSIIMLKDPMKRLWPVFYHENPVFVGFTRGWKPFAAANNLETGHLCTLWKDMDEDEPVYHVNITKKPGNC